MLNNHPDIKHVTGCFAYLVVFSTDKPAAISRVDVGGTTYVQTKDGVLEKISDSQTRSVVK